MSARYFNPRLRYYYFRFLKQTSAKLEFYFQFRFSRLRHHRYVILHLPTNYQISSKWQYPVQVGLSAVELWRHSDFPDDGRQSCRIFSRVTADHPRSAMKVSGWSSNFDSIEFIVSEILLFSCCEVLAWNCLIYVVLSAAHA